MITGLGDHWAACLESGLEGHTSDRHTRVFQILTAFIDRLKNLSAMPDQSEIMKEVEAVCSQLNRVNDDAGGQLLETDERELIVPLILSAATVVGLDCTRFENGDPTFDYRDF